jgi:3-isopropylmalate dehydrogenase
VAMILSVAMLLQYSLCLPDQAKAIEKAVENVIEKGIKTGDIGGTATTSQVGDAVAKELTKILHETS